MSVTKILLVTAALWLVPGGSSLADRQYVHTMDRYQAEEASTGYASDADVPPGAYQLYLQTPQSLGGVWGWGPKPLVGRNSFAADAHANTYNYAPDRNCLDCHAEMRRNLHSMRTTVTCRQCHEDEPVSGIFHYYSEMNPIRRHAYVCAKCHQGATANFAAYVVHEPNPIAASTSERFPALYYGAWFMLILAGAVFVFFIPYVLLWGLRELIAKLKGWKHDCV